MRGADFGVESQKRDTLAVAGKKFVQSTTYASLSANTEFQHQLVGRLSLALTRILEDCMRAMPVPHEPGHELLPDFDDRARLFMTGSSVRALRTRDWLRYNGASVVFEPKQMKTPKLRHKWRPSPSSFRRARH